MQTDQRFIGNNRDEITRVIHELYPDAHNTRHVVHGNENYIVIVDDSYVVRFPRSETVWKRTKLENFILTKLHSALVPVVIHINDSPAYSVLSFMQGEHLSEDAFRRLPVATQQKIGSQIAEFSYSIHTAIGVDMFNSEHKRLKLHDNPDGSYSRLSTSGAI